MDRWLFANSEPALDTYETVKVLHDINQQYGESLIDKHSNKATSKLVKQYRKRWFTVVVQNHANNWTTF